MWAQGCINILQVSSYQHVSAETTIIIAKKKKKYSPVLNAFDEIRQTQVTYTSLEMSESSNTLICSFCGYLLYGTDGTAQV